MAACYLQTFTHVSIMVTLSCFVFLRALYTIAFGLMTRLSDDTIILVIRLVSLTTSFIIHGIEIGYKVQHRAMQACHPENLLKNYNCHTILLTVQYKHGLYLLSKMNLYLFLGGPDVEHQRSSGFIGG